MKMRGFAGLLSLVIATVFCAATTLANGQVSQDVQVKLNGVTAAPGTYAFPFPAGSQGLVLDNGLVKFTFNGKSSTSKTILATSIVANGQELTPLDGQNTFYVDASGGTPSLACSEVRVLRVSSDLVEVAFVDTTTASLRPEHHIIMRRGKPGVYGFVVELANTAFTISELRVVTRWNRTLLDHAFNWEHLSPDAPGTPVNGQQPTYAYLNTQQNIQDETWKIDGINNPTLPVPESNSGNLPAGLTYTKYNWSLYHHENPMMGHFGHGYGAWFTPLGGVTDQTLAAFYGVGPNHQDLAIHQDGIILNYFGANHYGLPSYPLQAGYKRLYGPWFFFVTVGDPANPRGVIQDATNIAKQEIAENRSGSAWMDNALYPAPAQRTTVTGHLQIADGRPADGFWALLSTQNVTDVYTIHEPTYFVKTDANGNFTIPGVPPPWSPGTTTPDSYTLYVFASKGSITDQYKQTGITFAGATKDLGNIQWAPTNRSTFLWQIGKADRMGGEFALATNPADGSNPRSYEKPSQVPGTLTYTVGSSWEPQDWYYAQTNAGTWTIQFNLTRPYTGTAFLTVSSSMQQSVAPTVAVNGSTTDITGSLPRNNDSTISRQADRSGYPRLATLSFPSSKLVVGTNTITLTRGAGTAAGNGLGWDTFVLEADETTAPAPAQLTGRLVGITGDATSNTVTLQVSNSGTGDANDVRLDGFTFPSATSATPSVVGRDPSRLPVPIIDHIPAGGTATVNVQLDFSKVPSSGYSALLPFSANGGRVRGAITANVAPVVAGSVSLISKATMAKQQDGSFLATVTITNTGTGTAQNVQLTTASLGAATGSPSPNALGNIAPGSTATATMAFPASAGTTGATVVQKYLGTYTGGTFGASLRLTLP